MQKVLLMLCIIATAQAKDITIADKGDVYMEGILKLDGIAKALPGFTDRCNELEGTIKFERTKRGYRAVCTPRLTTVAGR